MIFFSDFHHKSVITDNTRTGVKQNMETTININIEVLDSITKAAGKRGVSRSEMILFFMKEVMGEVTGPVRYGKPVMYQDKADPDRWHTFHLQLREDDYEYLVDLRKLLKMSVSCILAFAVKKYLKNINTDNNRYKNYVVIKNIRSGIIFWTLIWGYPPNIEDYLPS
jgi:hypothetical protein